MTANTKSVLYKMWAVIATFALVVLSFPAFATTAAAQTQEPTIVDYLDTTVTDPDGVKVMDEDVANAKTETAPDEPKPTPTPEPKPGVVTGGDPTVPTNVIGLVLLGMVAASAAGLLLRRNFKNSTE